MTEVRVPAGVPATVANARVREALIILRQRGIEAKAVGGNALLTEDRAAEPIREFLETGQWRKPPSTRRPPPPQRAEAPAEPAAEPEPEAS